MIRDIVAHMIRDIVAHMMAPLARRVSNMIARGVVSAVDASGGIQHVQLRLLANEIKDGLEHFETYGLTACPVRGAEAIGAFFGGDRSHGVVLAVTDRRYRLRNLSEGDVALYDNRGQFIKLTEAGIVFGNESYQMTLAGDGISINAGNKPVRITNASTVRMETEMLQVTGMIKAPVIEQGQV